MVAQFIDFWSQCSLLALTVEVELVWYNSEWNMVHVEDHALWTLQFQLGVLELLMLTICVCSSKITKERFKNQVFSLSLLPSKYVDVEYRDQKYTDANEHLDQQLLNIKVCIGPIARHIEPMVLLPGLPLPLNVLFVLTVVTLSHFNSIKHSVWIVRRFYQLLFFVLIFIFAVSTTNCKTRCNVCPLDNIVERVPLFKGIDAEGDCRGVHLFFWSLFWYYKLYIPLSIFLVFCRCLLKILIIIRLKYFK